MCGIKFRIQLGYLLNYRDVMVHKGDTMPSRMYTIETRIPNNTALVEYLNVYVTKYSAVTREVWHDLTSSDFAVQFPKMNKYISYICHKHRLLKRTVNSIRFDVQGRMKSLMEQKKTELRQTEIKISVKEKKIMGIKEKLDALKSKALVNNITENELEKYRRLKTNLYWQKNKLNNLRQRKMKLEYQIENKVYSMCYGSKEMFQKQYHLNDNGFKTHEKWHNFFVKKRDKYIYYLGSSDESYGNQLCRLKYNTETGLFSLELRKENDYCQGNRSCDKYICMKGFDFKYMKKELIAVLQSYDISTTGKGDHPLTFRFRRDGNKWYLQVIFKQCFERYRTESKYGTIGLDYNDGFIEFSETDRSGNLIYQRRYDLKYHGTGNRAESEMRDIVSNIVKYAESRCKDIVVEDLNFKCKKARQSSSVREKGKRYNRMLHQFDYSRYKQTLLNTGFNHRVNVVMIDPKNTSKIGKQKYCNSKKLSIHQAASYVIARRGQGYIDRLVI